MIIITINIELIVQKASDQDMTESQQRSKVNQRLVKAVIRWLQAKRPMKVTS